MERNPRFDVLRQSADPEIADAIESMVATASDSALSRIDPLRFARERSFKEDSAIDAFVHASKLGLFEMSWNLLCPGCGGVLDASSTLKGMREQYNCALCACGYEPTLDEMVEVSFTVSPAVRRIAAHDPQSMPLFDYYRDLYFSNSLVLPRGNDYAELWKTFTIESEEVPAGERVILSVQLPAEFIILFEPTTHTATFLDITVVYNDSGVSNTREEIAPGPVRLTLLNRTNHRVLPGLFVAGRQFHSQFEEKQSFMTAKRLLTNQTFRDLYRAESLNIDQRLKIASLTVLFTDLKGSTELYERVGDLAAYDLVRDHFRVLGEVVRGASGAVVKTIGDAVMATFPSAQYGISAALEMRRAMEELNATRRHEDLVVKIGLHEGPCLAVISNDRLDYFGQTVNVAARVQGLATSHSIFATQPVVDDPAARGILSARGLTATPRKALLRGMADELTVYEID
jgi:class 3 adenylate cyclase